MNASFLLALLWSFAVCFQSAHWTGELSGLELSRNYDEVKLTDLGYDLKFVPLESERRCCTLLQSPYVILDYAEPTNFSGLAITYLELLQKRLGFSCSSIGEFKARNKEDQGFTGFTKEMSRCSVEGDSRECSCDIGISGFARPSVRFSLVDFVAAYSTDSYSMVTRAELVRDSAPKNVIFKDAFSNQVWGAIFSLGILIVLLTLFDRNFAPAPRAMEPSADLTALQRAQHFLLKTKLLYRIRQAVFNMLMHMVALSSDEATPVNYKQRTRQRVINLMSILIGFFLITVFQASVTVQVLIASPVSIFESIEDVKSCKIPSDRICVSQGGASAQFWKQAIEGPVASLGCKSKTPQYVRSYEAGFENVAKGKCDWFYRLTSGVLDAVNGRYCGKLAQVGSPFFHTTISFVLPKKSNLTNAFSKETLKLREEAKLVTGPNFADKLKCPNVTDPTLTWNKLKVFFYVAYSTVAFMFIVVILVPGRKQEDEPGISAGFEEEV